MTVSKTIHLSLTKPVFKTHSIPHNLAGVFVVDCEAGIRGTEDGNEVVHALFEKFVGFAETGFESAGGGFAIGDGSSRGDENLAVGSDGGGQLVEPGLINTVFAGLDEI